MNLITGAVISSGTRHAQPADRVDLNHTYPGDVTESAAFLTGRRSRRSRGAATRFLTRHKSEVAMFISMAFVTLLFSTLVAAQTLRGTVKNSTTGKPAAGDEVVLLSLGQGMEEVGHTKTDMKGAFSFPLDKQGPHLIRAIHEGVPYHHIAPPGTMSVALEVCDVAQKVANIKVFADIMRIHPGRGRIMVTREFGVQNSSNPPRTQMNQRSLEFSVPDGAQIIDASATAENGYPLKSEPVAQAEKNRYSFVFPLRPGLTRFAVTYWLPYGGRISLNPKSFYPLEHFVVVLPKAMQFSAVASAAYKAVHFPNLPDSTAEVASDIAEGQNLTFSVFGDSTSDDEQGSSGTPNSKSNARPGGGLGPPIDAPDPLQKYRWWIIGAIAGALLIGGSIVGRHQWPLRLLRTPQDKSWPTDAQQADRYHSNDGTKAANFPGAVEMKGIKEELFQIEIERSQGRISQTEYHEAKAAIDQTLERALRSEVQKV